MRATRRRLTTTCLRSLARARRAGVGHARDRDVPARLARPEVVAAVRLDLPARAREALGAVGIRGEDVGLVVPGEGDLELACRAVLNGPGEARLALAAEHGDVRRGLDELRPVVPAQRRVAGLRFPTGPLHAETPEGVFGAALPERTLRVRGKRRQEQDEKEDEWGMTSDDRHGALVYPRGRTGASFFGDSPPGRCA